MNNQFSFSKATPKNYDWASAILKFAYERFILPPPSYLVLFILDETIGPGNFCLERSLRFGNLLFVEKGTLVHFFSSLTFLNIIFLSINKYTLKWSLKTRSFPIPGELEQASKVIISLVFMYFWSLDKKMQQEKNA